MKLEKVTKTLIFWFFQHKSTAVYVRFEAVKESLPDDLASLNIPIYFLSWTTTPWSLAANRAIAFKIDAIYVLVQHGDGFYIVAEDLLKSNKELQEIFGESPVVTIKNQIV